MFADHSVAISEAAPRRTQSLGGVDFDLLSELEVIRHVMAESSAGRGGWVVTPNVDILRLVRNNPAALLLVRQASLRVPDGMPLIWAGKIGKKPFVERVTGSSLIFTLTEAAAQVGRSIYLLGGEPGVPEAAGVNLADRYPGLKVAGADAPSFGFDTSPAQFAAVGQRLLDTAPNIVYVGLGFPKQERVISELAPLLPGAWFIGCGAAISFAAGTVPRAPMWMQRHGLEWAHRLAKDPRRLFSRYLLHDLPYAAVLLLSAAISRVVTPTH